MTRERRANLIFLAIFLVASLPGLFLLLRKKADATIRPMGSPENVRPHLVFIDPVDAPEGIPRMAPALTMAWVRDLARSQFGADRVLSRADAGGKPGPVMSDRRLAQLIDARVEGDRIRCALIVWNLPRGARDVRFGGATVEASTSLIALPAAVKQDLQLSGLPAPPQQVLAGTVLLDRAPNRQKLLIEVIADGEPLRDEFSDVPAAVE